MEETDKAFGHTKATNEIFKVKTKRKQKKKKLLMN